MPKLRNRGRSRGQLGLELRPIYWSDEQVVADHLLFEALLRAIEETAKGRGIQNFRVQPQAEREGGALHLSSLTRPNQR